ncbi:hypothetical protein [Streptomyces sp. TLI_171]|uniref:LexA family protein n=1 Tax=Streptomyces sp. TLI_171 TaxID=1938859 RepID=UPI000C4524BF|nr:LexA DNA binding domain-containing protein [Streptomyces sp. TLI_171]
MTPVGETIADLWVTGTSVTAHPVQHARPHLQRRGALTAADRKTVHAGGEPVAVGGLVTHRQRPPTVPEDASTPVRAGRPPGTRCGGDGLTERQHRVIEVIQGTVKRRGYPPSMR